MAAAPLPMAQAGLASLNHLLRQQAWARDKLRAHAGRTVRMVIASPLGEVSSDAVIAIDGTLLEPDAERPGEHPGVTLTLRPSVDAVFGLLREGPRGLSPHLKVDGDVMLAAAVGEVAQHIRWEFEEDLSRVVGDRVAHRVGEAMRDGVRQFEGLRERVESGLRQYLVEEDRSLVARGELRELVVALREIEQRIERLERLGQAGRPEPKPTASGTRPGQ
jgi:ubiquinone biosynthesis accessory factor UbiJ